MARNLTWRPLFIFKPALVLTPHDEEDETTFDVSDVYRRMRHVYAKKSNVTSLVSWALLSTTYWFYHYCYYYYYHHDFINIRTSSRQALSRSIHSPESESESESESQELCFGKETAPKRFANRKRGSIGSYLSADETYRRPDLNFRKVCSIKIQQDRLMRISSHVVNLKVRQMSIEALSLDIIRMIVLTNFMRREGTCVLV